MNITDELRDYTEEQVKCLDMTKAQYYKLFAIADRIDAEHEKALTEMHDAAYDEGYSYVWIGTDDWLERHEEKMVKQGWMRLPKDADGVLWHIGDRDENGRTVTAIKLGLDGFWIRVGCTYRIAKQARHYHAPTVEDVLREFAQECLSYATCVDDHEVVDAIAEFSKRLKLAGDVE